MSWKEYKVTWTIEVTATSPREAAKEAYELMCYIDNTATVFDVEDIDSSDKVSVDLMEDE